MRYAILFSMAFLALAGCATLINSAGERAVSDLASVGQCRNMSEECVVDSDCCPSQVPLQCDRYNHCTPTPADWLYYYTPFRGSLDYLGQEAPGETVLTWWDYGTAFEKVGLHSVIKEAPGVPTSMPTPAQEALSKTIATPEPGEYPEPMMAARILEATPAFMSSEESELVRIMDRFNATYVVYDSELLEKKNSIAYLYCVHIGNASADSYPGRSDCEIGMDYTNTLMYKGYMLGHLEGFEQVYPEDGTQGYVRVFKRANSG